MQWYFGPRPGSNPENIALHDPPSVRLLPDFNVERYEPHMARRRVVLSVSVRGTPASVWGYLGKLELYARKARAAADPNQQASVYMLSVEHGGTWVYWDVIDAQVEYDRWLPDQELVVAKVYFLLLPFGRGDPVTVFAGPLGSFGEITVSGVPGDAPALVRATVTENGTEPAGSIRFGRHATNGSPAQPLLYDATAASGASTVTDTTAYGGSFARRSATASWAPVARIVPTSPVPRGLYDVYVRARDNGSTLLPPRNIRASAATNVAVRQIATATFAANTALTLTLPNVPAHGNTLVLAIRTNGSTPDPGSIAGWTTVLEDTTLGNVTAIYYRVVDRDSQRTTWTISLRDMSKVGNATLLEVSAPLSDAAFTKIEYTQSGTTGNIPTQSQVPVQLHEFYLACVAPNNVPSNVYINSNGPFSLVSLLQANTATAFRVDAFAKTENAASVSNAYYWTATSSVTNFRWVVFQVRWRAQPANVAGKIAPQTLFVTVSARSSGSESQVGAVVPVYLESTGGISVSWDSVAGATGYRVYVADKDGKWYYQDVTGTSTLLAQLPTTTTTTPYGARGGQWRAVIEVGGQVVVVGEAIVTELAGDWAWLRLGTFALPPALFAGTVSDVPWAIRVEVRHPSAAPNMDADCCVLMSHLAPQLVVRRENTTGNAQWVIDASARGDPVVVIRDTEGSSVVGLGYAVGDFTLEPGTNRIVYMLESGSGASRPSLSANATIVAVPRYAAFRPGGSP